MVNQNPIPTYFNPEIGPNYQGLSFEDIANSFNNGQQFSNQIQQQQQKGILARLIAQNTGTDGQVDLNKSLQSIQTNPNQSYQPEMVNTLSGMIQQQNAAKLKAQNDALELDADLNKKYAETGKLKQEGLGKGLENSEKKFGAINQVFQSSALSGSKSNVLLGLQNLYQTGTIDAATFNQQRQIIELMKPEEIKEYASNIAFGSAKDPASILYQTANNREDNQTSRENNAATVGASIYSTKVGAETADKNRVQQDSQFQQNYGLSKQKQWFDQNKPVSFGVDIHGRKYRSLANGRNVYEKDDQGNYIYEQQKGSSQQNSQLEEQQRIGKVRAILNEIGGVQDASGVRDGGILKQSTNSYLGRGIDHAYRLFGGATDGDIASGKLGTLGGQLVALMPKMSGPQSDKDVAMYKQMAGKLDDPTIPYKVRMAALESIDSLNSKYSQLNENRRTPYANAGRTPQIDTSFMP